MSKKIIYGHNLKMSDVEVRRESRRRKILENSKNRLERITGVQQRNASYELEGYKSTQNIEEESNIENHIHNGSLPNCESLHSNHFSPQIETIYRNPLLSSSFLNRSSVLSTSINQLSFTKTYKVPIIIGIACLMNLCLFLFQNNNFLLVNKIFIPLLCFEAIHLFYNQNSDTNDEITNILQIFFRNISPHYLSLLIKYFTLFITITRDVMIYFFAFVCIWFIFKVLHGILLF